MSDALPPIAKPASRTRSTDIVLEVLRAQGPCSQAELARLTGLSKGTINNVVKALLGSQAITLQQKNRKEALVVLGLGLSYLATVEVHAYSLRLTLFDFGGQCRRTLLLPNETIADALPTSPEQVLQGLQRLCAEAGIGLSALACVSIAIQASIDRASGSLVAWAGSRLPGWKGIVFADWFAQRLAVPVIIENDANLAALCEWTWGCGKGSKDFFYLMCDEGVGGGLILDGHIYRGGTGVAGEVGHMVIADTGAVCFCGGRGCLHSLISERAILAALSDSESPQSSLAAVIAAARQGDAACRRVLFEAGRNLGRAVANTARVIAPSVIAIGGTLSFAGEFLMTSLESSPEVLNLSSLSAATRLQTAEIADAVTLGGVAAALAHLGCGMATLPAWMTDTALTSTALDV